MCRSTDYESHLHGPDDEHRDPFSITYFFVHLHTSSFKFPIPDSLTLLLYPSLINKIPPYSPATLSLHRMQLPNDQNTERNLLIFGSKQRVHATNEVLKFQLYVGETKLLKGEIRKDTNDNLKLKCCSNSELPSSFPISEVDLWVSSDGHVAVKDKVVITASNNKAVPLALGFNEYKRNNKHRTIKSKLEDIPEEETEFCVDDDYDDESGTNPELDEAETHLEMDLEVLRKAFDMGIWVLCLGVGYMVSRSSITKSRLHPSLL